MLLSDEPACFHELAFFISLIFIVAIILWIFLKIHKLYEWGILTAWGDHPDDFQEDDQDGE